MLSPPRPPAALESLPAELKLLILDVLTSPAHTTVFKPGAWSEFAAETQPYHPDLLSLCVACPSFAALRGPPARLFRSLMLENTARSGAIARAVIAVPPWRELVEEVQYVGLAPFPEGEEEEEVEPRFVAVEGVLLPPEVADILGNLRAWFPRLERLCIEFPFSANEGCGGWWAKAVNWSYRETDEEMLEAEGKWAWRALMRDSIAAITRNEPGTIKALDYRSVPPRRVSTWDTDAFRAHLRLLDRFRMSLVGDENGVGWQLNTTSAWQGFVELLGPTFFAELDQAWEFTLAANESGPLGGFGTNHQSLCLKPEHLLNLIHLRLELVFIDLRLREFLEARRYFLESLELRHCFSADHLIPGNHEDWAPRGGIRWETFWDYLAKVGFSRLVNVTVEPVEVELNKNSPAPPGRAFAYASLSDKYGYIVQQADVNARAIAHGGDRRAWERFMEMVEENKKRREDLAA